MSTKTTQGRSAIIDRTEAIIEMWDDEIADISDSILDVIKSGDEGFVKYEQIINLAEKLRMMAETNMVLVGLTNRCPKCGFEFGTAVHEQNDYAVATSDY